MLAQTAWSKYLFSSSRSLLYRLILKAPCLLTAVMPTGWVTQDKYWSPCPSRAHHPSCVLPPEAPPGSSSSSAPNFRSQRVTGKSGRGWGGSWSSHLINHKWDGAGEVVWGWGRRRGGTSHWCVSFITKKEQPVKLRVGHLAQRFSVLFLGF